MLKIRLQKIGRRNNPSFRLALVESTTSPRGKFIELLGSYNPKLKQKQFKKERIEYWLSRGAKLSATVHNLLVDEKIINEQKVKAWRPKVKGAEAAPDAAKIADSPKPEEQTVAEVQTEQIKSEELKVESLPEATKPSEPSSIDSQEQEE